MEKRCSFVMQSPQRLGRNRGGYLGERLDVLEHLESVRNLVRDNEWQLTHLPVNPQTELITLRRIPQTIRKKLYLSTGIHGDEPAGPLAVLQLLRENNWPPDVAVWLCPCLNPSGFLQNRRENADGIDLNRDYRSLSSAEVQAHVAWLAGQPAFDLSVCLHEDWEAGGFYLYEVNPDGQRSFAEAIIARVSQVCPIECATQVDGWEAAGGIIRPRLAPAERPQWPETLYLITRKTRLGYTLEAPSDFAMSVRVTALVEGVRTILERLKAEG